MILSYEMCIRDRGNTGALLAAGLFVVGRIKGIDRPGLMSTLPVSYTHLDVYKRQRRKFERICS